MLRRPAVLPDDRVAHRLSTAAVPNNRGLALVGDADGRDVRRVNAKTCHCLKTGHDGGRPKIRGVMFDPPGAGQVLSKFLLLHGRHLVMLIEENCATGRRALIDCEDVAHDCLPGQS